MRGGGASQFLLEDFRQSDHVRHRLSRREESQELRRRGVPSRYRSMGSVESMLDLYHRGTEIRRQDSSHERIEHAIDAPLPPDYQEDGMAGTAEMFGAFVIPMTPRGRRRRRRVVVVVVSKVVDQLVAVEQLPILVVRVLLECRSRSRVTTGVGRGDDDDDDGRRRRREERAGGEEVRNDE